MYTDEIVKSIVTFVIHFWVVQKTKNFWITDWAKIRFWWRNCCMELRYVQ